MVVIAAVVGSVACILLLRAYTSRSSVSARRTGVRVLGYRSKYSKVQEQDPTQLKDGEGRDVESEGDEAEATADAAGRDEKSEDGDEDLIAKKLHMEVGSSASRRRVEQVTESMVEDDEEAVIAALNLLRPPVPSPPGRKPVGTHAADVPGGDVDWDE